MKRIILEGSCKEIDRNINYILALCKQTGGKVGLVGIVCKDRDYKNIGGIPCVEKSFKDYDYVICLNDKAHIKKKSNKILKNVYSKKMINLMSNIFSVITIYGKNKWKKWNVFIDKIYEEEDELSSENFEDSKEINIEVLYIPGFDFLRYIELRENGVSIISNNCWGGLAYHYLNLPMKSPFVNMWMLPEDYIKLVNNLEYYLKQRLTIVDSKYDIGKKKWYPIVALGDVRLAWNHCFTLEQLKINVRKFIRRSKRVDYKRLFAFVYFEGEGLAQKYVNQFENIPIKKKIGISYDYEGNGIYLAKDYSKDRKLYGEDFFKYINSMVEKNEYPVIKPFDIFKMLNLEEDYYRI